MAKTGFITPGNLGIVSRPCTDTQQQQNWSNVGDNILNLSSQIGDPSTIPPIIAQIPGLDGLPSGPGGPGTPGTDGAAGAPGMNLTSVISQLLRTIEQILQTIAGGAVDNFTVKVNSADTPAFLEDQWRDGHVEASAQYNAAQDFLVEVDTVDVGPGDKLCRFYIDSGDITGFSTVGKQALITDAGAPKFIAKTTLTPSSLTPSTLTPTTVTPSATTVVTDVSWDEGTCVMTKTTGTVYTFPSGTAINVFPSSSIVYVWPNGSAVYVFPNSSAVNYFQG